MTEPITLNLTLKELQQIDKYVEMNDDTLPLIIKIENAYPPRKSAIEEAYKEWMGEYPPTTPSVDNTNDIMWRAFQIGWMKARPDEPSYYDELVESEPEPQEPTPNKFLQRILDGKIDERGYVDLRDPTSTVFRQKLFDGIKSVFYDPDYERTHWKLKVDMAVDEVLTHFYDILPEPEEPVYGDFDKGMNCCLAGIKMRMEFSDDGN